MTLYEINKQETGVETVLPYTTKDAEKLFELASDVRELGVEVEKTYDTNDTAIAYLDGFKTILDTKNNIIYSNGMETFDKAMSIYIELGKTLIGSGNEEGLLAQGTEAMKDYVIKALTLVKKVTVKLKKIIMKAVAKLIGMVSIRKKKIAELKNEVYGLIKDDAKEFSKDDAETLQNKAPAFNHYLMNNKIFKDMLFYTMMNFHTVVKSLSTGSNVNDINASIMNTVKSNSGWDNLKNLETFTKLDEIKKFKFNKIAVYPGLNKMYILGKQKVTGKFIYKKVNYLKVKNEEIKPADVKTMEHLINMTEIANHSFGDKVDSLFKSAETIGKDLTKAMNKFIDSKGTDEDKASFEIVKELYSLIPRFAFDSALELNRTINFVIEYVDKSIKAHAKESN